MYLSGLPLATRAGPPKHRVTTQPYRGITDSIKYMSEFALEGQTHPQVRAYAIETVRQVEPKDYLSEAAAIYYRVCRDIRYTRDPANREYIQHPAIIIQQRAADCDDQATLIRALLGAYQAAVGAPIEFIVVGFDKSASPGQRYTHVFVRVQDTKTGQWLVLDPVAGPHTRTMISKVQTHKTYPV